MTAMTKVNGLGLAVLTVGQVAEQFVRHQADRGRAEELFGDGFSDDYAEEAEQRWGETEAGKQSQGRTSKYTRADWAQDKAEMDACNAAFVSAMVAGDPATSERAMDAAEQARLHIHRRFYDLTPEFHRNLGDLYVTDPRFTKTYEDIAPGLAQYVRDAIHANAARAARAAGTLT